MAAWALRTRGFDVEVLERTSIMRETSAASTKLLHGGLRYLEHGSFRLVREALAERSWWLAQAPGLCHPIELLLPIRKPSPRSRWKVQVGLWLYDQLAGKHLIHPFRWIPREEVVSGFPELQPQGLVGAFSFWDAQMDDHALGLWAAARAQEAGVRIREQCPVDAVGTDGFVRIAGATRGFDVVVNVAGPWIDELLRRSGVRSAYQLDLVRGSHLVTSRPCRRGVLAEVPRERRIGFVLPWKGGTLVGTTEVRQDAADGSRCSEQEADYLRKFYGSVMVEPMRDSEIIGSFAGVRPLIRSSRDPSKASREYAIERSGRLINVFGGKWTTARALADRIAEEACR
jgi:glycerol-3-phosphate dehydrogenase